MNYLSEYQTFSTKQEMNETVNEHLHIHRYHLTNTIRDVLTVITRYAVKFPGVAHLKAATIAEIVSKSEKTVRRAINTLCKLKIISKVSMLRKVTGGQGANVYVINQNVQAVVSKRKQAEKPMEPTAEHAKVENEPYYSLKQNTLSNTNTYADAEVYRKPYANFKATVNSFISDRKLINRLYGIYLAQTSYLKPAYAEDDLISIAKQAVRATFIATKRKALRNIAGYFNGVLNRKLDELLYATMATQYDA